jgi:hypothetical protein
LQILAEQQDTECGDGFTGWMVMVGVGDIALDVGTAGVEDCNGETDGRTAIFRQFRGKLLGERFAQPRANEQFSSS